MTSFIPFRSSTRGSRLLPLRTLMALGTALVVTPTSLFAGAQVQGSSEAVRIETQNTSIEEVLAALGDAFDLRYRSSTKLAKQLSGTYQGSLQRVVARVLEGYDFILRSDKGKIEITVLGTRNAAPAAAVGSPTSNPSKAAPIPAATPAAAAAPSKGTEQPAPTTPPPAPAANATVVSEGQSGLRSALAELSKVPGMNLVASARRPAGLAPNFTPNVPLPGVESSPAPIPAPGR